MPHRVLEDWLKALGLGGPGVGSLCCCESCRVVFGVAIGAQGIAPAS